MKNKLFLLALLTVSNLAYGYRHVVDTEHIVTIEKGAYEDLLRTVDEYNRMHGKNSNYLGQSGELKDTTSGVDIVAIGQFTNTGKYMEDLGSKKGFYRGEGYHTIADLIEKGTDSLKQDGTLNKLPFVEVGDTKRFYFGNGNVINDIKFTKADTFKENADKAQKDNNVRYHLTGSYMSIDTEKMNQLNISMDDYKNKIEGKSKEEVAKYLQNKLEKEKNIKTTIKNGELYTTDDKGNQWRVLYNLEPVSVFQGNWAEEKYKDEVFSKIFVYKSSSENGMSTGDLLYTNDGNILIEDKYSYKDNVRLPNSNKTLDELIKEGENSSNPVIKEYFQDKEKLDEKKFKEKWITPFEKDGEFDKAYTAMQKELTTAKQEEANLKKSKDELYSKAEKIKNDSKFPGDFDSNYKNKSEEEKQKYLTNKSEEVKNLITEYEKTYKNWEDTSNKYWDILNEPEKIKKKYGFYDGWGSATDAEKKWAKYLKFIVKNDALTSEVTTKNIELRGKGRINGTVDLGDGYNKITITEHLSGEFGTNIILGPEATLKNVDIIYIGGKTGTQSSASVSGRTSLALDIDKNIKNNDGELIQHAFRNSDKDIIFSNSSSANPDSRNNFSIEMMVSRLDEDSIINMGRKLDYEARNPEISGNNDYSIPETLKYKINMVSDSIAHDLVKLDKTDKDGNTLMKVTLKDSIKMLDNNENEVYRSIKNSGYLGSLHETLTTTNKKTIFSVAEDEQEEIKELKIAKYLRENTPEDLIKDLSQLNYNEKSEDEMKKMISNLKERQEIKDAQEAQKQLNAWKKDSTLSNSLNTLNSMNIDKTLSEFENYSEEQKENKYNEFKKIYDENISSLHNKTWEGTQRLSSAKELRDALDELDSCFNGWNADKSKFKDSLENAKKVIAKIEKLMNDDGSSIDKELSEKLKKLEFSTSDYTYDYKNLYSALFYTMRQEESLKELKILLDQVYEKNIYSRLNKASKDEINVFTYIPFNIKHDFKNKNSYVNGGSISTRNSMDGYKGNIYSGYGIYETKYNENMNLGFVVGGASSNYKEMKNDSLDKTSTESKIKGTTAYLGGYSRLALKNNFEWINGGGIQYGKYDITRNFRNSYQNDSFNGDADTKSLNAYSGIIYKYDINDSLSIKARGILSYTFINQSDINEKEKPLSLNIKSQNYNYLDGETGISLTKTMFGSNSQSSISGGVYSIFALMGADNDDMSATFNNSSSSFNIKGHSFDKNSVKMFLDYNFYKDSGFNYGLEGSYTANGDEDNITIGVKAGYYF